MLTLYFSGTGNTKYIAELFSRKTDAACYSIEADVGLLSLYKPLPEKSDSRVVSQKTNVAV